MRCRLLRTLFLVLALLPIAAVAESRHALIIGNSSYTNIDPLKNPRNDAELIATALRNVNFDVKLLLDADMQTMDDAVNVFVKKLDDAGREAVGLFYFAGHGISLERVNYLIPVGAKIQGASDVKWRTLPANQVLERMDMARNEIDIIILDACRNNPFPSRGIVLGGTRSVSNGMSKMESKGSYIAFSTAEGEVAYDGDGAYSPFAEAFAAEVGAPDISIYDMMSSVRRRVQEATDGRGPSIQRPWSSTSMTGIFRFNPTAGGGNTSAVVNNANAVRTPPEPVKSAEDLLWERVKGANTIDDYDFYLKEYPKGQYTSVAKYEKRALKKQQQDVQPVVGDNGGNAGGNVLVDALGALMGGDNPQQQQNNADVYSDPSGRGMPQQAGQSAIWYGDDFVQWQVAINGSYFSANTFYPGVGPMRIDGQFQGYAVQYGIYDGAGVQIGYGQGTYDGQSHISAISSWMNGVEMARGQFHINHPPN